MMKSFIKVMKALSDPNRVKILKMLQKKKLCVCEMQFALKIAQPTVSNYLKILKKAGLVDSMKDGLWVNYHLADGTESPYTASLLGNLTHWLNDHPDVAALMEKTTSLDREEIVNR